MSGKVSLKKYKTELNQLLKSFDVLKSVRSLNRWSKDTMSHYTAMHIGLMFEKIAHSSLLSYEPPETDQIDPSELPDSNWPYLVKWLESILDCLDTEDVQLFQLNLGKSSDFFSNHVEIIRDEVEDLIQR